MSEHDEARGGTGIGRRTFLQTGAAGAIGLAAAAGALTAAGCGKPSEAPHQAAAGSPGTGSFELEEMTLADLQKRMTSGEDTTRSLIDRYIARIDQVDKSGPMLRSLIEVNPDAHAIAASLDAERRAGHLRGPLHGIPVIIKDNIGTADQMPTAAGSLALATSIVPKDAFIAQKLREAGAVILGKANLSEWANYRSTHSSSGWSGRGGQCANPYALDRNPSGSSAGSGAATSANLCAMAIGTETNGSIVSPSNANGVVGLKPTVGLWSRSVIIPISQTQDTAGPMGRTVADVATLLGPLTGVDPADPATAASAGKSLTDYRKFLDPNGLKGARLGVPRQHLFGYSPAADRIVEAALDTLKKLGAEIIDPADIPTLADLGKGEGLVLSYEFKAGLNAYLAALGPSAPVHTLADIIAFNDQHKDQEMPYFGQELFLAAEARGPLTSKEYLDALASDRRLSRTEGIDAVMDKYKLDAFVCPTGAPASLTDLVNGGYGFGGSSAIAAIAGYPHITVPAGYHFGLPVGLSFFGRAWSEPTLIRLAYAFEQATKHRTPPKFLKTANLAIGNA
ncbi:MAG TPA: amidase [Vicinamibacterales bacterium]|nr:amidase [Vicinamibacterales bacterium]